MGSAPLKKTFFLHIPKCGGTSITAALSSCYETVSLIPPYKRTDAIAGLNSVASLHGADVSGLELGDYREQILFYFLSIPSLRYVGGHYTFSEKAYRAFSKDWCFVTMLRHPVSRWFSHYFFNRYKEGDHCKTEEDLRSFVDSKSGQQMGHFYTYYLTGEGKTEAVPAETVDKAIENLKKFSVVGCLEHSDIFVQQFEELQKVKLNIKTTNINPLGRSRQEEQISDEIRAKVVKICEPDIKIYNYALSQLPGNRSFLSKDYFT